MSIPSWAVKGAKVVCIKRDSWVLVEGRDTDHKPGYGDICTIKAVVTTAHFVCLTLVGYGQHKFRISRFRPLVSKTQEDDLKAHFAHHLHQNASRKTEERV